MRARGQKPEAGSQKSGIRPPFSGIRFCLRWSRRILLAVILAVLCAFIWADRIGLPDFLKQRLIENLHERGVELQFVRLRLSLVHGLLADNVRIGQMPEAGSQKSEVGSQKSDISALSSDLRPLFTAQEVRLEVNWRAALHRHLQLDGLVLHNGKFTLPLSPTNGGEVESLHGQSRALVLEKIQTELRFGENDTWSLDNFQAVFASARLTLAGEIAHAPEMRDWGIFHAPKTGGPAGAGREQLKQFADALRKIHFTGTPQLDLHFIGDARDVHSFNIRLVVAAPGVESPWAGGRDFLLTARLTAPADAPTNFDSSWAWWTNLQPYRVVWSARLVQLKSEPLSAESVDCSGLWSAPVLAVTNLAARLGGGTLNAAASLNVATRELDFTNDSRFDLHAISALLTEKTRERLADFSWRQPPMLRAGGSLVLPAWTNRQPDWRAGVQPTARLQGEVAATNLFVSDVAVDRARTHFSYSNLLWQLPDVEVTVASQTTNGEIRHSQFTISGSENDATKDYRWHLRGAADLMLVRPFLTASNAVRGFSHLTFAEPLHLDADVSGRLYDYDSIAAAGRVALTNFTVRGEVMDSVAADFSYTNRVLDFFNPRLWRGAQTLTADKVTLDFDARLIWFKNGFSTADPGPITRAIGPKTAAIMAPYQFLQPPTAFVEGRLPLRDMNGLQDMAEADMRFDIVGGVPFQCLKLRAERVAGTVRWRGGNLELTNVTAELYGGTGSGSATFDFRVPHKGADYQFEATASKINLHALANDLSPRTNHLEGQLEGMLIVTRGDTRDWHTMDGYGHARLRDGLLWDIPVFGFVSPLLNAVSPGLGSVRATDAKANFFITNGVISSNPLQINTATTRLEYSGTVDLRGNLNAKVTAQALHNIWVIGPLVSTLVYPVTKIFEYKITGTLENPKSEPLYMPGIVPKILSIPFHPIRTLEGLFPSGGTTSTNTPPGN